MSFFDWFIGEAGGTWITLVIMIASGLLGWLFSRKRATIVIIQNIAKTKLLGINRTQQNNIQVYYTLKGKGVPIRGLIQKELVVYNGGTQDILEPLEIVLDFFENSYSKGISGLGELVTSSSECNIKPQYDESGKCTGAIVKLPYLNSFSKHKHFIPLTLISESDVNVEIATQAGKGWSTFRVYERDTPSDLGKLVNRIRFSLSLIGYLLILLAVLLFIFGIIIFLTNDESSAIVLVYFKPTPERIDAYLAYLRNQFEIIRNGGRLEFIKYSWQTIPGMGRLYTALIMFLVGNAIKDLKIVEFFAKFWKGIQPSSSFPNI
ncbi:MAG: hypothetical protein H6667_14380 [Ardenticatenaceae bacterium]|nr:hypothetical protein [Ardenticatenaceae bacterium]MCB9444242.1 hypothetical protein [Ardenticatenaceae bacterium]